MPLCDESIRETLKAESLANQSRIQARILAAQESNDRLSERLLNLMERKQAIINRCRKALDG